MNEAPPQKPARARLPLVAAGVVAALAIGAVLALRPSVIEAYPEELAGVGIVVKSESSGMLIGRVIDGGPAADAGLRAGDRIVAIDGESTDGRALASIVAQLRGRPDSEVVLQVTGAAGPSIVTVKRRVLARGAGNTYAPH